MSPSSITYEQITDPDHPDAIGFMEVYRNAFGRAPYFEVYDDDEVILAVWRKHLADGCVFVAKVGSRVVGLSCAHVASNGVETNVQEWLLAHRENSPFNPDVTTFMSELAVHENFEGMGIGSRLLQARLRWGLSQGHVYVAMRTADRGSNSARLYERYGAVEASELLQSIPDPAGESHSKVRMYYWGELQATVDKIEDCQADLAV